MPPGALGGRLSEALAEQVKADEQTSYEILIEQGRLAQNNTQFALTTGQEKVRNSREMHDKIQQRAFDKAMAASKVIIDIFDSKVKSYLAYLEEDRANAEFEKLRVDTLTAANTIQIDRYGHSVEKFKAKVAQELGMVENIAKVYGYKIAGYEADAKVAEIDLNSQIEAFKAKVEQANNQTALSLSEAEMVLKNYLAALELDLAAIKAGAEVSTQLAASALSSVNASASIGASVGISESHDTKHSTSISNTATIYESHTIGE